MAAPKHNRSDPKDPAFEKTRKKIQATQLAKRLEQYALGQKDCNDTLVELTTGQVRAIEVLLKKTIPDLQALTIAGDPDNPLQSDNTLEIKFVDAATKD